MQAHASQSGQAISISDREHPNAMAISRMLIAVINEASRIEPDSATLLRWYVEDPIESLGRRTAAQLVTSGQGELVVRFLRRITCAAINR